jgi:hypothetical protein
MMNGMSTLHQDSMKKVRAGFSTMEESIGTVPPDIEDMEAVREEFAIEAEAKSAADAARKSKLDDFRRNRQEAAAKAATDSPETPTPTEATA